MPALRLGELASCSAVKYHLESSFLLVVPLALPLPEAIEGVFGGASKVLQRLGRLLLSHTHTLQIVASVAVVAAATIIATGAAQVGGAAHHRQGGTGRAERLLVVAHRLMLAGSGWLLPGEPPNRPVHAAILLLPIGARTSHAVVLLLLLLLPARASLGRFQQSVGWRTTGRRHITIVAARARFARRQVLQRFGLRVLPVRAEDGRRFALLRWRAHLHRVRQPADRLVEQPERAGLRFWLITAAATVAAAACR